jgi:hypothetical protein
LFINKVNENFLISFPIRDWEREGAPNLNFLSQSGIGKEKVLHTNREMGKSRRSISIKD